MNLRKGILGQPQRCIARNWYRRGRCFLVGIIGLFENVRLVEEGLVITIIKGGDGMMVQCCLGR